jgi:hypothetical protein
MSKKVTVVDGDYPKYRDAVVKHGEITAFFLQTKFAIGYARASSAIFKLKKDKGLKRDIKKYKELERPKVIEEGYKTALKMLSKPKGVKFVEWDDMIAKLGLPPYEGIMVLTKLKEEGYIDKYPYYKFKN